MIFVLHRSQRRASIPLGPSDAFAPEWVERWTWDYRQGTKENPGDTLAVSPAAFSDEKAARSNIAKARKAFGGARMAKVIDSAELIPSDD